MWQEQYKVQTYDVYAGELMHSCAKYLARCKGSPELRAARFPGHVAHTDLHCIRLFMAQLSAL